VNLKFLILIPLVYSTCVLSSATLDNTRVIYLSDNTSGKSIKLSNNDPIDYIVQVWTDRGEINSTPSSKNTPFVTIPPSFKSTSKTTQLIKLIYTGPALPLDRESIFYLNVAEIPPVAKGAQNVMGIIFRDRLKIFYRPHQLNEPTVQTAQANVVIFANGKDAHSALAAKNNSPYFINLANGKAVCGNTVFTIGPVMLPPFTQSTPLNIRGNLVQPSKCKYTFSYINDYGGLATLAQNLER
jgi:fimbrial chaperone protein